MTHSLPPGLDATFAEPRPDGNITVIFKDTRQYPQVFDFVTMGPKGWTWRRDERGAHLVVFLLDGSRVEIPEIGILMVQVKPNSDEFAAWNKMSEATEHVIHLEHHLQTAKQHMFQARKEWEACHATSSSS